MRKVYITGDIDYAAYIDFCNRLDELEESSSNPISLELTSGGGESYIALAFYARIRRSPCAIIVTAYGQVQSAATIILPAGTKAIMDKDCYFMVHDDVSEESYTDARLANIEAAQLEALEVHWASILARHSNVTADYWREASRRTTYYTAQQCLELGLIQEVTE